MKDPDVSKTDPKAGKVWRRGTSLEVWLETEPTGRMATPNRSKWSYKAPDYYFKAGRGAIWHTADRLTIKINRYKAKYLAVPCDKDSGTAHDFVIGIQSAFTGSHPLSGGATVSVAAKEIAQSPFGEANDLRRGLQPEEKETGVEIRVEGVSSSLDHSASTSLTAGDDAVDEDSTGEGNETKTS